MLKGFLDLLGEDAPVLRRYAGMALLYGLLGGLTLLTLVPVLGRLLSGDPAAAWRWLPALAGGMLACWALRRRVEQAGISVGVAVLGNARLRVGEHVARLPVGWFSPEHTARLGHVLTQGMMSLAQLPAHVLTPVISGLATPLVLLVALLVMHPLLGATVLLGMPMIAGVVWGTTALSARADRVHRDDLAEAGQRVVEFSQAQSVLRAFGGEGGGTRALEQALRRQRDSGRRLVHLAALSSGVNVWTVQALFAVLFIIAARGIDPALSGGDTAAIVPVVLALVLIQRIVDSLLEVAGYADILRGAAAQLAAVSEILASRPLPEPAQALSADIDTGRPALPRDASVELRGVSFRYAPGQPEVLRGLDLRIEPGSMTALIGASGSGKTTLARLIARFFDVSRGAVLIGGVDVRELPTARLAGQISQIFQDGALLAGSIGDNIRMGRPEATDEELLEAARQAGVTEILARLPQGLDTPVGEGGALLSGGERQRVAIARALIKRAPILLVDEATAALDAENQAVIAQTLTRLRGQCTLVVIAHQLSTVAMADQIVVLEDGEIREQGDPATLARAGGRYARFLALRQAAKGWRLPSAGALTRNVPADVPVAASAAASADASADAPAS